MNATAKLALIFSAAALALPHSASAKGTALSKQFSGNWQLNLGKSKFSSADYTPKSGKTNYSVEGNRLTSRSNGVTASGTPIHWGYTATLDGKWARVVGNPNADQIALTPVSEREFKTESRLKGKAAAHTTQTLSLDGKELTIHRSILTAKGGPTDDSMVYDRTK